MILSSFRPQNRLTNLLPILMYVHNIHRRVHYFIFNFQRKKYRINHPTLQENYAGLFPLVLVLVLNSSVWFMIESLLRKVGVKREVMSGVDFLALPVLQSPFWCLFSNKGLWHAPLFQQPILHFPSLQSRSSLLAA